VRTCVVCVLPRGAGFGTDEGHSVRSSVVCESKEIGSLLFTCLFQSKKRANKIDV
jgi:hypothetical protein